MSPKMFEFAKGEVDKLLKSGIIEPSVSDWRSAPVITWRDDKLTLIIVMLIKP